MAARHINTLARYPFPDRDARGGESVRAARINLTRAVYIRRGGSRSGWTPWGFRQKSGRGRSSGHGPFRAVTSRCGIGFTETSKIILTFRRMTILFFLTSRRYTFAPRLREASLQKKRDYVNLVVLLYQTRHSILLQQTQREIKDRFDST